MKVPRAENDRLVTLLRFGEGDRPQWYRDRRLERYLHQQGYALNRPHATALLLVGQLQTQPAPPHDRYCTLALCCYLQECLWQVAEKLSRSRSNRDFTCQDYFQAAYSLLVKELPSILNSFDCNKGTLSGFCYQRLYNRVDEFYHGTRQSNWGLLRTASQRRIREALGRWGYAGQQLEMIRGLVYSWQQVTTASREPDTATLCLVSRTYHQCFPHFAPLTPSEIDKYLKETIQALRQYNTIEATIPLAPEEEEKLADTTSSLWQSLLSQEQQAQVQQVVTLLEAALKNLDDTSRRIVCLYYCENVNQTQIAQQLGLGGQHKVSRLLAKTRKYLVNELVTALQPQSLTEDLLRQAAKFVDFWLQGYFQSACSVAPCRDSCSRVITT